jgi:parallel beta-helix repeat protein
MTGNNIEQNVVSGIWIDRGSSNDDIVGNNIQQNSAYGVWLSSSSNNNIYHNNFVNNTEQVYTTYDSVNNWDEGYPAAGNYWSDYTGQDLYSGPFQNETSKDGVGDTPYVIDQNNVDHYPLTTPLIHDVGITGVSGSKTIVGQGFTLSLYVNVTNYGRQLETFTLFANANSTVIKTQTATLAAGSSGTLTLSWKTSGFAMGNYTLSAYVPPVLGEVKTADNNCTGGVVVVSIPGDLNGDFKVDLTDLTILAYYYKSTPGDIRWNPNVDIDNNGYVGLTDLTTLALHYGQHYP